MYTYPGYGVSVELAGFVKEVGAAVTVAIALAAVIGLVAVDLFPSSNPTTAITSATPTTSSVVFSTAPPCGSPGVYCGGSQITSRSLTVHGNYSVLELTLSETGNMYIGSATVYVNGIVIGVPPASEYEPPGNIILNIQPGQQAVLVLTIPNSTLSIQVGRSYSILVYDWEGPPGQRASAGGPVEASVTAATA